VYSFQPDDFTRRHTRWNRQTTLHFRDEEPVILELGDALQDTDRGKLVDAVLEAVAKGWLKRRIINMATNPTRIVPLRSGQVVGSSAGLDERGADLARRIGLDAVVVDAAHRQAPLNGAVAPLAAAGDAEPLSSVRS
jgi:hypothetical protein